MLRVACVQQTSTNPSTGYAPPRILSIVPVLSSTNLSALSTNGGQDLLLVGSSFGPQPMFVEGLNESFVFLEHVTYGITGNEYTPVSFRTINHTHIVLTTSPSIGRNLVFVVTVAGQSSEVRGCCWGHTVLLVRVPEIARIVGKL